MVLEKKNYESDPIKAENADINLTDHLFIEDNLKEISADTDVAVFGIYHYINNGENKKFEGFSADFDAVMKYDEALFRLTYLFKQNNDIYFDLRIVTVPPEKELTLEDAMYYKNKYEQYCNKNLECMELIRDLRTSKLSSDEIIQKFAKIVFRNDDD